jgi:hypothetical protein
VLWLGFGAAIGLIVVRRLALRRDDPIAERVTGRVNRVAVGAVTSDVFQDLRNFTTLLRLPRSSSASVHTWRGGRHGSGGSWRGHRKAH